MMHITVSPEAASGKLAVHYKGFQNSLSHLTKADHKGFEIFGVSLDAKEQNWRDAIAKHKMEWVHVSNVKYWDTQSRKDYAVNSIPANFLIDCATGKIVAKNLRGEALKEKIAELLD